MSLKSWQANGWLRPHATSRQEIGNLLAIVERDLQDAQGGISPDWRFGIAYNAALKLCTILLYAEGYRPERSLQHTDHLFPNNSRTYKPSPSKKRIWALENPSFDHRPSP